MSFKSNPCAQNLSLVKVSSLVLILCTLFFLSFFDVFLRFTTQFHDFYLFIGFIYVWQIRTAEMDLIAERGIAAHYCGRGPITSLVGNGMPGGRNSRGKTTCLNNADIALRVT